jgi:hypothetical protein
MSKSVAVSLAAILALGAGIVAIPVEETEVVGAAPFWQLHGAAPSAAETSAITQLRLAARQGDEPAVAVALVAD